jgi:hypothetical protein
MNPAPEPPQPLPGAGQGDELFRMAELEPAAAPVRAVSHRATVDAMAEELQMPVAEVARAYYEELARVRGRATVLDYLPVLIAKKLRALFRCKPVVLPDEE